MYVEIYQGHTYFTLRCVSIKDVFTFGQGRCGENAASHMICWRQIIGIDMAMKSLSNDVPLPWERDSCKSHDLLASDHW